MLNLADAHDHELFDKTMDIKTGYRTCQMLCVLLRLPAEQQRGGVLQIINCRTAAGGDGDLDENELDTAGG